MRNTLVSAVLVTLMTLGATATVSAHSERGGAGFGWRQGLPLNVIKKSLRWRDFSHIRIRDGQLPVYKFKACRNGKRFVLFVNRWGKIMDRVKRGYCGREHFGRHLRDQRGHGSRSYDRQSRFDKRATREDSRGHRRNRQGSRH